MLQTKMSHETCFWDNSDDTTAFSRSIIHHFANDTNLIFSSKKLGNIEFVINELKHLVQWLKDKMLSLNKTTTELIKFGSTWRQLQCEPNTRFKSCKLKLHIHVKYSEIFIDKVLSWSKQIDILCSKLSSADGILSTLNHFAPLKTYLSVYCSIFYLHLLLLHSCLAWSYTKKSILIRLINHRNIAFEFWLSLILIHILLIFLQS